MRRLVVVSAIVLGCHDLSAIRAPRDGAPDATLDLTPDVTIDVAPEVGGCAPGAFPVTRFDGRVDCRPVPKSCADLTSTCGTRADNCCEYSPELGSPNSESFSRGYDRSRPASVTEVTQGGEIIHGSRALGQAPAFLRPFFLDRYEVTIGRFRRFYQDYGAQVNNIIPMEGQGANPREKPQNGWNSAWEGNPDLYAQTPKDLHDNIERCDSNLPVILDMSTSARDSEPMACVTWYEAFLFCIWDDNAYLPSDAQWNFAAAGGAEYRPYPWVSIDATDLLVVRSAEHGNIDTGRMQPVGRFLPAKWNHYDLAGNVWEFVLDACAGRCDEYDMMGTTLTDPVDLPLVNVRENGIVRGGSFNHSAARARTAFRLPYSRLPPAARYPNTGWRCARW